MKFLRYLNPFFVRRTIAALRSQLAVAEFSRDNWRMNALVYAEKRNDALRSLEQHEQAVDAFMADREELQAALATADAAGLGMTDLFVRAMTELAYTRQQLDIQARETLEVVQFVKQASAVLAAGGITIEDAPGGIASPRVVVEQAKFLTALQNGGPLEDRDAGYYELQAA
jgi:hypothetical protein